jgi:hypothetical protein
MKDGTTTTMNLVLILNTDTIGSLVQTTVHA